jgi:hypothetical protein
VVDNRQHHHGIVVPDTRRAVQQALDTLQKYSSPHAGPRLAPTIELLYLGAAPTWNAALDTARRRVPALAEYAFAWELDADCLRLAAGVALMPEGDMVNAEGMRVLYLLAGWARPTDRTCPPTTRRNTTMHDVPIPDEIIITTIDQILSGGASIGDNNHDETMGR